MATVSRVLRAIKQYMGVDASNYEDEGELTIEDALSYPPVFYAATKICGAFQTMKFELLRKMDMAKEVQSGNRIHELVSVQPNSYQTAEDWRSLMVLHRLFYGNGRSVIIKSGDTPVELLPLDPTKCKTRLIRYELEGVPVVEKFHWVKVQKNDAVSVYVELDDMEEAWVPIPDSSVWHLLGISVDGVEGIGVLDVAKRSIGLGIGAEKLIQRQNKKGFGGGLFFKAPVGMFRDEGAAKEWLSKVKKQLAGADGDAISLLRENMEVQNLTMNNSDAQMNESRKFQREEAALLFALESILGDSSNSSYASEVQKWQAYKQGTLAPIMVAIEAQSRLKLLTPSQRARGFYFAFDDRIFLRMDPSALMAFGTQAITSTVLNPNEVRELMDYNPREGGDIYQNPATSSQRLGGADNNPNDPAKLPSNSGDKATQRMLAKLLKVESKRCRDHANSENFIGWMDEFYSEWESKLADEIEAIGGDRDLATEHCNESKRRLLEACECQPEQLTESITKCVSTWENRVNQLMEGLAKCSR